MTNGIVRCLAALWLLSVGCILGADPDAQVQALQSGVRLTLIAQHPNLVTPTGIDVDDQGRLWVVATHTHFRPEDYDGPEHDEILVFGGDADADRRNHSRQVFYNATDATMDLELGPDGWVYLAERDRILRIKDTDGDGRADAEQNVAVLTTQADYPHNGLSGLAWHPDGDLLFGLGENYAQPWTLSGTDGNKLQGTGEGGIVRCTADGRDLRRIARGFWNPFAVCVRDDGEIFAADNDPGARPPCRLLHVVEGGDYGFQRLYGPEAHHPFVCWNGELRGTLPMIHPTGESPCGVQPLAGGVIVPTWSDHRIDFYPLRTEGASFTSERIVLVQGDKHFRPVCIAPQTDRSRDAEERTATFYLTDWTYVSYQLHGQGRLWKLEIDLDKATWLDPNQLQPPGETATLAAALRSGLRQSPRDELLKIAADKDPFLAQAALLALSRQASQWNPSEVKNWTRVDRVLAVQALKLAGGRSAVEVNVHDWVGPFLEDESTDVRFETLRWICDAQLTSYLGDVEQLLHSDNLDFHLFEAIMATQNTLQGNPADGIRNVPSLLSLLQNESVSPQLRAYALRLLPTFPQVASKMGVAPSLQFPTALTVKLLRTLLDVNDDTLSREVVRTLVGNPTPEVQRVLAEMASDEQQPLHLRVEAVSGLAAAPGDHVALLVDLADHEHRSLCQEALRSLRGVVMNPSQTRRLRAISASDPQSADLVHAALDPSSLRMDRPAADDIDAWQRRLNSISSPADPDCGERIFHHPRVALCTRCHRHSGRGNPVGPDLSQVGQGHDRRALLESLLQPSAKVAPEYRARTLVLSDGQVFTGIHLRTGGRGDFETLRDSNGQERRIRRSEIETSRETTASLMPAGLADMLTDRELRDLLAFLETTVMVDGISSPRIPGAAQQITRPHH